MVKPRHLFFFLAFNNPMTSTMSGSNMKCQATQQFVSQDYFIDFSGVIILHLILTHSECSVVFWYQNLNDGWLARGLRKAFPWVVSMDVQWMFLETYQQTGIHIFLPCARWHHSESQFCCISDPNVHSWSIFLSKFRPLAFWIHIHGIPFWIEKHRRGPSILNQAWAKRCPMSDSFPWPSYCGSQHKGDGNGLGSKPWEFSKGMPWTSITSSTLIWTTD